MLPLIQRHPCHSTSYPVTVINVSIQELKTQHCLIWIKTPFFVEYKYSQQMLCELAHWLVCSKKKKKKELQHLADCAAARRCIIIRLCFHLSPEKRWSTCHRKPGGLKWRSLAVQIRNPPSLFPPTWSSSSVTTSSSFTLPSCHSSSCQKLTEHLPLPFCKINTGEGLLLPYMSVCLVAE